MFDEIPFNLLKIIIRGERIDVEFKESKNKLPSSMFETICGMLNRRGGHIFLGVKDNGEIIGVDIDSIRNIRKSFAELCNNPEKIFPTIHLEMKEYAYENKTILYVYVYESSDVHKTANRVFDRNEDGDFDITSNTTLVSRLYIRKSNTYIENKIYPYAQITDLRKDLINKARIMATNRSANHPWANMTDIELLRSASLYERDLQTGKEGINLAGILLFGKDEIINSALSYYRTDAILKIKNVDRYDDRDDIKTNLIESYERLVNFMKKHLNEKFHLENNQRINIIDIIARELCTNLLIHREYSNPVPARLIINRDSIVTENANKPRNIGYIDLNAYSPYPKNPKIANVFKEIGLAEELGSGIKTITKYNRLYSNATPKFKDDEIFSVTIPLKNNVNDEFSNKKLKYKLDKNKSELYNFIKERNGVTREEINKYMCSVLDIKDEKQFNNKLRNILTYLQQKNLIENRGSLKKSKWFNKM